jgi:hypothetical protein
MSYRVFWSPQAEAMLERILDETEETENLTAILVEIDRRLAADPADFGESRFDTVRVGFVPPLAVQINILEDVQSVIVDAVWRTDH